MDESSAGSGGGGDGDVGGGRGGGVHIPVVAANAVDNAKATTSSSAVAAAAAAKTTTKTLVGPAKLTQQTNNNNNNNNNNKSARRSNGQQQQQRKNRSATMMSKHKFRHKNNAVKNNAKNGLLLKDGAGVGGGTGVGNSGGGGSNTGGGGNNVNCTNSAAHNNQNKNRLCELANNKSFKSKNKFKDHLCRAVPFFVMPKYVLPVKNPRRELIIPPTKFLLGGNISDPLNLNSLQDEALKVSIKALTPLSSPITPPKVEVIIPPNIHDPLHLLDPVDSIEYEKQLSSPVRPSHKFRQKNKNRIRVGELGAGGGKKRLNLKRTISFDGVGGNKASTQIATGSEHGPVEGSVTDQQQHVCKVQESPSFKKIKRDDRIVSPVVPQPGSWKRLKNCPFKSNGQIRGRHPQQQSQLLSPPGVAATALPTPQPPTAEQAASLDSVLLVTPSAIAKLESGSIESAVTKEEEGGVQNIESSRLDGDSSKATLATASVDQKSEQLAQSENKRPCVGSGGGDKSKYLYGNYDKYSGYRILNEFMDIRLKVFMKNAQLFTKKDILDVGCNAGHMTIAVAKFLNPKSIVGVDIDGKLIEKAKRNLSCYVRVPTKSRNNSAAQKSKNHKNEAAKMQFFPMSFPLCYGPIPNVMASKSRDSKQQIVEFPLNVSFKKENYVPPDESSIAHDPQQYDLVLCLSVTKWIHLNFGDAGIRLLFKRIFNQLRPGGKLILESQNWASYKKDKNKTETINQRYKNIRFYPNKFHEYLLSTDVGFSHSYLLGIPRHLNKGFKRPIQLYIKGDFTPSQVKWSDAYHPQTPYEPYRGIYLNTNMMPAVTALNSPWPLYYTDQAMPSTPSTPFNRHNSGGGGGGSNSYNSCHQTPSHLHTTNTSIYFNPAEREQHQHPQQPNQLSTPLSSFSDHFDNNRKQNRYCFISPLYYASAQNSPISDKDNSVCKDVPLTEIEVIVDKDKDKDTT